MIPCNLIPELYANNEKSQINYFRNYLAFNVGTDGFEPSTLCL